MSDQKIKTAAGKCPLDLVPLEALKGAARVFEYGARKYAKGNWWTATDDEFTHRYVGGALRHLCDAQNFDGTYDFDSLSSRDIESGLPEVDHMICGLLMLRGLLIKRGVLAADPGVGKEPPYELQSARALVDPTAVSVPADIRMQTTAPLADLSAPVQLELPFEDYCECRECVAFSTLRKVQRAR